MIDLISLVAILTTILGAIMLLPTDNQDAERAAMIRAMMKMRKRRGYRPCGE